MTMCRPIWSLYSSLTRKSIHCIVTSHSLYDSIMGLSVLYRYIYIYIKNMEERWREQTETEREPPRDAQGGKTKRGKETSKCGVAWRGVARVCECWKWCLGKETSKQTRCWVRWVSWVSVEQEHRQQFILYLRTFFMGWLFWLLLRNPSLQICCCMCLLVVRQFSSSVTVYLFFFISFW